MNSKNTSRSSLVSLGLLVAALLACKGSTVDKGKMEGEIKKMIETQTGTTVATVTCPADLPLQAGGVFECPVTFTPAGNAIVTVTQSDGEGSMNMKLKEKILIPKKLEVVITQGLSSKGLSGKVDCGNEVRRSLPNTNFLCSVLDEKGKNHSIKVEVQNTEGSIIWKVQ